ncbi:hypothetical protein GALMADRAFT_45461, partial [Galerina marginata CBS 339.88]
RTRPGSSADSEKAEEVRLWFPSALPSAERKVVCTAGLSSSEEKLRTAQCHDSLAGICDTLQGTRSRELINRVHNRARKFAAQYRAARAAKLELSGPGSWENVLRVLHNSDIQQPDVDTVQVNDGEGINLLPEHRTKRQGTGQTRLTISWIWTVIQYEEDLDDEKIDGILRAEWSRSRARVNRAIEEVKLLREEMRRVLAYLDWKAGLWINRQNTRPVGDVVLQEGLKAYCLDQSSLQLVLKDSFQVIWKRPL